MSYLGQVISDLATPSDQLRDWYDWATGQCGHVLLGAICALYFHEHAVLIALIIGGLKEVTDLLRRFDARALLDSVFDLSFWCIGAWVFSSSDHILPMIIMLMALTCGIIPRVRAVGIPNTVIDSTTVK